MTERSAPAHALAVVVVAHQSAHDLRRSLQAVIAQLGDDDELVVVDNASTDGTAAVARATGARVIETGTNAGFAGGANAGAAATTAPLLMLLNPDAIARPGAVAALRDAASEHPRWGAWQALVTMSDGTIVNSAGNVIHYLGFGWAGRCGRGVDDVGAEDEVAGFASGAALVVRREAWDDVGGFDDRYFMYGEDLDLGLRLRLRGWSSGLVPPARVEHDYSFVKGDYKWFYLERNRLWTVLGAYPARLLLVLAPALVAFEAALLVAAAHGGWLRPKLRSYAAVARELPAIVARRREIQATRVVTVSELSSVLTASLDSPELAGAARVPGIDALQRGYWRLARRLLG